jgi:hypothetical protein
MKYFWVLFSFFIFSLSVSPCCDDGGCEKTANSQVISSTFEHNHEDSDHKEICSPFCVCACCGNHVSTNKVLNTAYELTFVDIENHKPTYRTIQFSSKFEVSIWQPPQIV